MQRRRHWPPVLLGVVVLATAAAAWTARAPEPPHVIMYKGAECTCCLRWGSLLTDAGFTLDVRIPDDLSAVFAEHGVTPNIASCHVAMVDGYAVVGHVPIAEIQRLLRERPAVAGITVPGMPASSPGMDLPVAEPVHYDVLTFDREGNTAVYARY